MKKTKALAKMNDIYKPVYYENALYEHDHKNNRKNDLEKSNEFNVFENHNKGALMIMQNGILYN